MASELYLRHPQFPERIAASAYTAYEKLPKKGKPQKLKEWTLLSAVIMKSCKLSENKNDDYKLKAVALGTGSKCIGKSQMSLKGDIINDSHAEILARRSFLRFLYEELGRVSSGRPSEVFTHPDPEKDNCCSLQLGVSFHFFTSHTPCGDASIFPKEPSHNIRESTSDELNTSTIVKDELITDVQRKEDIQNVVDRESNNAKEQLDERKKSRFDPESNRTYKSLKRKHEIDDDSIGAPIGKKSKESVEEMSLIGVKDTHRTGAKCVPGGAQDPQALACNYHTLGVLRTKPGRGVRTESLACSDKMARWNVLGCQGALISMFLTDPIYLASVTVGRCPFSLAAMQRALHQRLVNPALTLTPPYHQHCPVILQASGPEFEASKAAVQAEAGGSHIVPSPAAITWFSSTSADGSNHDVIVKGKRQGFVKKDLDKPNARAQVCSWSLFQQFYKVLQSSTQSLLPSTLRKIVHPNTTTLNLKYFHAKALATPYQQAWAALQLYTFTTWLQKPRDYLNFTSDFESEIN